jgi:hypothetical protein
MGPRVYSLVFLLPAVAASLVVGCGGAGSSPAHISDSGFSVGGTVSGLSGGQIILENNAGNNLTVSANGSFTFSTSLAGGSSFLVSVLSQPSSPAQTCIVNDPGGVVTTANATSVQVACSAVPASPAPVTTAAGDWTWANGDSVADQAGVYGQIGVPAVGNVPGGRSGAVGWTDSSGNLWLFGGLGPTVGSWCSLDSAICTSGTAIYLNDLWKYDGSEWSWMAGSSSANQSGVYGTLGQAAAGNAPGSRYGAVSWSDGQGNFWLFGGTGFDSAGNVGALNDLWKYSGGQWTWVSGAKVINQPGVYGTQGKPASGNIPGSRAGAIALADPSGNVWLFGGNGYDSAGDIGALNDLWEYSGGQWTWVDGLSVTYPTRPGVYGTQGTPASGNIPGARYSAAGWMDHSGNLWVFGGAGYNLLDFNVGTLNDLMKFGGGDWTWMGGYDDLFDQFGTYGTEGTPASGNVPGSRDSAASWTDANGNLWLFSGEGFGAQTSSASSFNDLWEYSAGEWTWVGGSGTGIQSGTYGMLGVPAAGNIAGSRISAVTWTDAKGNLWLFGGFGEGAAGSRGNLNDLWVYQPQ